AHIKRIQGERVAEEMPSLWLTGHSLGGAMATMASARLVAEDRPFFGAYTFGQPRAGTREFARAFAAEAGERYFRFQNNSDIVTRLPARLLGYSHVGKLVYINRHGALSDDKKWWYRFLDRVTDIDIGDGRLDSVHDHSIDVYIRAIGEWADQAIDQD
ncbi:MAG: lipase family protein, partial [Pseudomonadota bacterium]